MSLLRLTTKPNETRTRPLVVRMTLPPPTCLTPSTRPSVRPDVQSVSQWSSASLRVPDGDERAYARALIVRAYMREGSVMRDEERMGGAYEERRDGGERMRNEEREGASGVHTCILEALECIRVGARS